MIGSARSARAMPRAALGHAPSPILLDTSSDAQYSTGAARTPRWRSRTGRCSSVSAAAVPASMRASWSSTPSITGYQEILTDPSYAGQIVTFTFPHIGNVGTNDEDIEALTPVCPRHGGAGADHRALQLAQQPAPRRLARQRAASPPSAGSTPGGSPASCARRGAQNAALAYLPGRRARPRRAQGPSRRPGPAWRAWTSPARSPAASATAGARAAGPGARAMAAATAAARTSWPSTTA